MPVVEIDQDPFTAAANRVRQSAMPERGRSEGLLTRVPETIADSAARSVVNTAMFPGMYVRGDASYDDAVRWAPEMAMNMVGMPALTGGIPAGAVGSSAKGIRAYHGSPHDFDRFDISKIGTGEGAQAYGHGLYFAEKEGVAREYQRALSGAPVDSLSDSVMKRLRANGNSYEAALKDIEDRISNSRMYGDSAESLARLQQERDMIANKYSPNPGRMYEVNINARPEQFLDWDKPLSQQAPEIQKAFSGIAQAPDIPGRLAYYRMADKKLQSPEASKALNQAGIPGIKYLDQGSRRAGQGSHNYVVFDDKIIDILKKYGILGPTFGGATALGTETQSKNADN